MRYDISMTKKEIELENQILRNVVTDLHWMARRYVDNRQSYATSLFNEHVRKLLRLGMKFNEYDATIWARDQMGRAYDGLTEAEATDGTPEAFGSNYKPKNTE
jgi:hypothetical protein